MDLTFSEHETAFRDELRALARRQPARARARATAARTPTTPGAATGSGGCTTPAGPRPHWPAEYGGRGASLTESAIYFEELGRARVPLPANVLGLLLGGPTLMVWGTDEQKERYLAADPLGRGDLVPGLLRARRRLGPRLAQDARGQGRRRLGRHRARRCGRAAPSTRSGACSSRAPTATPPSTRASRYFLMDMEQEAVQVRPLRQITGEAEFNELFIEEARIPDENVVGGVGNGWKVALTTLMNERAGLGFALQVRLRQLLDDLIAAAPSAGCSRTRCIADALADLHVRCESIRLLAWKGLTDIERYGQPGPGGLAGEVAVVGHQPAPHPARRRRRRPRGADRRHALELRAAARPRQHDRGRHHRGAQEHRRRARARPARG